MVGVGGLEPPTPASQTRCASSCATPRSIASIPAGHRPVKAGCAPANLVLPGNISAGVERESADPRAAGITRSQLILAMMERCDEGG
jgi:hypothetical protein